MRKTTIAAWSENWNEAYSADRQLSRIVGQRSIASSRIADAENRCISYRGLFL